MPSSPSPQHLGNMITQQSSVVSQPEQHAALVYPALTEQEWEEDAMTKLRTEIDRMDAIVATTAATTSVVKFIIINGLLYVKAWLVSEKGKTTKADTSQQNQSEVK
jgi:hypothetical protein